jgi:UDP-N-acetylglucosamine 3-dehydrogenase
MPVGIAGKGTAKNPGIMIRFGVIGAGNIGFHHCRVISADPHLRLAAVIDTNLERAKQCALQFGGEAFASLEEALATLDLHAVVVSCPTHLHVQETLKCLKYKLHVLVEKPAAVNPDDARLMVRTALQHNLVLATGQVERFNPAVLLLKEIMDGGSLGKPVNLVAKRVGGFPPGHPAAGVLADLAIHDLDLFYFLIERHPIKHCASYLSVTGKIPDASTLFVDYGTASGFIQVNWITPVKMRQLSVTGTLGYAELNFISQEIRLFKRNVDPADFQEGSFEDFYRKYAHPEAELVKPHKAEPLALQIRAFSADVKAGQLRYSVPVSEVIPSLEIIAHHERH